MCDTASRKISSKHVSEQNFRNSCSVVHKEHDYLSVPIRFNEIKRFNTGREPRISMHDNRILHKMKSRFILITA